jgi:hypothetical protein
MKTENTILIIIAIIIVLGGIWYFASNTSIPAAPVVTAGTTSVPGAYIDSGFGFSFTYPVGTSIAETTLSDTNQFPGATAVKSIQVGDAGGVLVYEVTSPNATITDEPNGHASPISQTKYFYDATSASWMVAYPEGRETGLSATTSASINGYTNSGLPIFPSGRRFDTVIIPLSPTKFVVVTSGGGGDTTSIAQSITPAH